MSLGAELKSKYMYSICRSDKYKEEFTRLKEKLLETAETDYNYEVLKEEYPNIMSNKRMLSIWLDENELDYRGTCSCNKFVNLSIEW